MKSHTSEFKEEIKTLGKQQSVRITYTLNNEQIILTDEDINSATPNYEASLLKSVMKVLELDSNVSIPKGTEIKFEYGLLVNGAYEYLNYGNYIVAKEPEKQEDTLSYKITCYDKMLYSMKDYEHIEITYPCTIKEYLIALCNKIGLEFKDSTFANQDREIQNELFMTTNEDGTYSSMGYTYRDVLDQIAETTGGCICLTLDDKVEVRYVNKTINYEQSEKSNIIQFKTEVEEPIILERLEGKSIQATRSGKNLLNLSKCSFSRCTLNSDNKSLTCNINDYYFAYVRTTELNNWLLQNKGKKITFSTGTTLEGKNTGILIYGTRSDGSTYQQANETGTGKCSITIADDFTAITSIELRFNRQKTPFTDTTTVINYAMLELGAVATEYEPYGASPSPDYPSEIENIEGNIEFKVEGKNLVNIPDITLNNANYIYNGDIDLKPNTYTLSMTEKAQDSFSIAIVGENGTLIGGSITLPYTFTIEENAISMRLYSPGAGTFKGVQIEEGTQATPYEPYKSQVVTFPLGEEKLMEGSYLASDGIHHTRKQVVLDGTESGYDVYGTNSGLKLSNSTLIKGKTYNGNDVPEVLCNYLIKQKRTSIFTGAVDNSISINNNEIFFRLTNIATTVAELKTWLQSNPITVEYELAEPETVPYTAEQKTILTSIKTMKGTNIFEFPSDTIISYPKNYDTIDEEYINDTNVSFGEKYRTNKLYCTCKSRRK